MNDIVSRDDFFSSGISTVNDGRVIVRIGLLWMECGNANREVLDLG